MLWHGVPPAELANFYCAHVAQADLTTMLLNIELVRLNLRRGILAEVRSHTSELRFRGWRLHRKGLGTFIHDMEEESNIDVSMLVLSSKFHIGLGTSHPCHEWQWLPREGQQGSRVYARSEGGLDEDMLIVGKHSSTSIIYRHLVFYAETTKGYSITSLNA
jgi:hypothetical protein